MKLRERGQALVEFSMVIIVFLVLMMAIVDIGRGIYMYNGVSQAAREISRTTSVHPGSPLGTSTQTAATIGTQKRLIPGLQNPQFDCVDINGDPASGSACFPGHRVQVTTTAPFTPIFGLVQFFGTFDFEATSTVEITNN